MKKTNIDIVVQVFKIKSCVQILCYSHLITRNQALYDLQNLLQNFASLTLLISNCVSY